VSNHDLYNKVADALKKNGFELVRPKGGHMIFGREEPRLRVPVPVQLHDKALANRIFKQARIEAHL
jgi:predicted RNA binding protein YcfA (HicA-like mRNA interferase family)